VQFLSLQPKTSILQNTITGNSDEFVEHGTVLELQQYYIDVKSLEIVFQLIENNYFAP
jgi:hypothetical protein